MDVSLHNSANNAAYEMRSANDWINYAKQREIEQELLGDLWREGEFSVLFGDPGAAKSVFAMQAAEVLASGSSFAPFSSRVEARPVIYVDTMSSDKQFESRYAADHEGDGVRYLQKHYRFAETLTRVEYDAGSIVLEKGTTLADVFCRDIRQIVAETGTKTLIIDSLSGLLTSHYGNRQLTDLLVGLRRLRKQLGLSILVIIQTTAYKKAAPLTMGTTLFRAVACRTDGIFGLCADRTQGSRVYLKQLMYRNGTMVYTDAHVPVFTVAKQGGNFLSLDLDGYSPEHELLEDVRTLREWETIEHIKELSDAGLSLREIAAELSMAKTTVHKLLSMWRPPSNSENNAKPSIDDDDLAKRIRHFPGCEVFHDAKRDERFANVETVRLSEEQTYEERRLIAEYVLIDIAHDRAGEALRTTGVAPTFDELMTKLLAEYDTRIKYYDQLESDDNDDETEPEPPNEPETVNVPGVTAPLTVSTDARGHTIYIESTTETGKPKVWYKQHQKGGFNRYTRSPSGITTDRVNADLGLEE